MKRFCLALALILIVATIAGCGAAALPALNTQSSTQNAEKSSGGARSAIGPAAPPMAPAATPAEATAADALKSGGAGALDTGVDRLIIRNGNMVIFVKDVADSTSQVAGVASEAGGVVLRSDSYRQDDKLFSTVVIKVPAEKFDEVMASLRKMAVKVDSDNTSSQDVTEEFVDLTARLTVLQATQQQLMTFLQKTQNVDESLKVYRELNNTNTQIEQIKGRMNYLQKSAAMSSITVQIRPQESTAIVQESGWSPTRVVRDVLRWLVVAMQGLFYATVFVVLGLAPIVILIAVPVLIVRAVWRRMRRTKTVTQS